MPAPTLLTPKQIIVVSGGGNYIVISSISGATLTCGNQSYTLDSGETSHVFSVDAGTYTCTASKTDYYDATQSVTISTGQEFITLIPTYLPTTYQQIEYLHGSGNQYIVTNVSFADNQIINLKFRVTGMRSGAAMSRILDARNATGASVFYVEYSGSTFQDFAARNYASNFVNRTSPTLSQRSIYDITITPSTTLVIDGTSYPDTATYGGASGTANFYLWKRYDESDTLMVGDIFKFTITQSGTKIIELVPCYRKSDSVLGMWDKVSDTFLTNSGTGTFTAGPNVN